MKNEFKVIAFLVSLLLMLEVGFRVFEVRLSKDVEHLRELPKQASLLRQAPVGDLTVLVMGNSLARCGIDVPQLASGLKSRSKRDAVIAQMHPDGGAIEEWVYGYRKYFQQAGAAPRLVLLIIGQKHLPDQTRNIAGMGAYFVSAVDAPQFAWSRLGNIEDCGQFLTAKLSSLAANRSRIQPRLFYDLIPAYDDTAQQINRAMTSGRPLPKGSEPTASYSMLAMLAAELRKSGTQFVIATAPMPKAYELPPDALQAITAVGAILLQLGATLHLPEARFPDGYHLDATGASMFTEQILEHWPTNLSQR